MLSTAGTSVIAPGASLSEETATKIQTLLDGFKAAGQAINHSAATLSGDEMGADLAAENAELKRKLIEAQGKIIKLMEEMN